jgi:5-methylcytosine-specific restriction endonuclease McrA
MFDGRCAYCGVVLPEKGWQADHIEPIKRNSKIVRDKDNRWKFVPTGTCSMPQNDHFANIFPSCRACNINKGSCDLEGWRKFLERRPEEMRKQYSAFRHAERFGLVAQIESKVVFYFEKTQT